jgi:ATP-dependent Clp protease ATP-binding subunit ClpA
MALGMWEPFTERARHAIVRAQEVAQLFGSSTIGTEHIGFALAETDDPLGEALAKAIDREALRGRLGSVSASPSAEMSFSGGAKRTIELAFENARRLNHNYIGTEHLALGVLASGDPPPLRSDVDPDALAARIDAIADSAEGFTPWKQIEAAAAAHPAVPALLQTLQRFTDLAQDGTRVSVTVSQPGAADHTWTFVHEEQP